MRSKFLFILAFVAILGLSFTGLASAQVWKTCSVVSVGADSTAKAYIQLTDTAGTPAFTSRYFTLVSTAKNELLASALTALSSGKNVVVQLANTSQYANVNIMYVQQ